MKRFSAYLTDEQYEQLRLLAFKKRCKLNKLLCEALKAYLAQETRHEKNL